MHSFTHALEAEGKPAGNAAQSYSSTITTAPDTFVDELRALGYADNAKGTSGLIDSLKEPATPLSNRCSLSVAAKSQYADIIRQLPSPRHTDMLVHSFFENVAWHYDIVDETTFRNQLFQWSSLSSEQMTRVSDSLPIDVQSFPSLLFQVLAQSLLFQPIQYDESLNDLKYAADMELSDRAADYSNAGHQLAALLAKSELTILTVQAALMQACFEKTTGAVLKAWHTLGSAISDARKLGLHLLETEPSLSSSAEKLSNSELGRNLWFNLHLWDAHMAVVLGRPMRTRLDASSVPLPLSRGCGYEKPKLPHPRDVILCGYHTAYRFLQNIQDLESREDHPTLVESIHNTILTNIANLPAWASTQRQREGEPPWLSAALETMLTNVYFVLFALHRPFIFTESSSRGRAFHSAMEILQSQVRLFDQTEPLQYMAFSLVYTTFDAMVLIAALHLRFTDEFMDQLPTTNRNLQWGLNRLDILQTKNKVAGAAFKAIHRLYQRLLAAYSTPTPRQFESHTESSTVVGSEADMPQNYWDGIQQSGVEDVLFPRPLTELLCNQFYEVLPEGQINTLDDLSQLQFEFDDNRAAPQQDST